MLRLLCEILLLLADVRASNSFRSSLPVVLCKQGAWGTAIPYSNLCELSADEIV